MKNLLPEISTGRLLESERRWLVELVSNADMNFNSDVPERLGLHIHVDEWSLGDVDEYIADNKLTVKGVYDTRQNGEFFYTSIFSDGKRILDWEG